MGKLQPKLRFPEFICDWNQFLGNELFNSVTNKNHNSDLPVLAISQEYGAIPRHLIDYKVSVTDKSLESYKIVEVGDFIISLRSFQGGIEYSTYKGICSPAYIILKPIVGIERIFYKYYFKTDKYIIELNKKLEGIRDGKMVSFKYFSEIEIPFPTLPEQTKIASFLTTVDEKISGLKKQLTLLERYKKGVMQKIFAQELRFKDENGNDFPDWEEKKLGEVCLEHKVKNSEKNIDEVFSVAKHKGVINQIEHLGRPYSANDISHYKIAFHGDLIYTKSPTSDFPFGIIKQNKTGRNGVVSPLYCVLKPLNFALGSILHEYFLSSINTYNYLAPLVQKGAKNTMNINNNDFLNGASIKLPVEEFEQLKIASFLSAIDEKVEKCQGQIKAIESWKKGLLQQMFV